MNYAIIIRDRLKMPQILTHYGIDIKRGNRIKCPLHNGEDYNCGVKDDYIHCFVCGKTVDQIGFIMDFFGLTFQEALRKIDVDFGLNLYQDHSFEELRRQHYRQKALEAERKREKREKQKAEDEYWAAFDEWKRLDDNRRLYAPKSTEEEFHPLFVEALQKIHEQEYILDCITAGRKT